MPKVRTLTILGFSSLLFAGSLAAAPIPATPPVAIDHLFQHWVLSYEEAEPGQTVQIFRPEGSRAFPPSRFRMAYKFARSGSCERYVLSPDDSHYFEACAWSIGARDKTLLRITGERQASSFKIVELSAQILRLEPVE